MFACVSVHASHALMYSFCMWLEERSCNLISL